MATRNRTAAFIKYREAFRQSNATDVIVDIPSRQVPRRGDGYIQVQLSESFRADGGSALPPVWVDVSERVKEEMQRIRAKMSELAKAHARALLPNFDNSKSPHEENIELLTQEITRSLKRCEKDLQRLTGGSGGQEENKRIAKNVQRSMATDLQQLSMDFRKQSKGYLKRLEQQQEAPVSSRSNSTKSKFSIESPDDEDGEGRSDVGAGFDERQVLRVKRMENVSAEREQEVNEIVTAVNDLAQMMKDLSVLVIDQGSVVDRIDYNIQAASSNVEKGVKQLVKAENSQRRSPMLYCILLLAVLCLVMLAVLIVKKTVF
eukprot:TRINITY_DN38547_c0_g1_i1.p1 TRINITY_DN38547_c0_g1~~TRINITY_DN38547_c0_g1_i1.p1  ORF type:complete len:318 (+),score=74.75 TRINITY_DN38547_c0_g1_i1:476-1429(+)